MSYTIQDILREEKFQIYMQAIISHNEKFSVGMEAFVKGICPSSGDAISPLELFAKANEENLEYELSIAVFKKSVKLFCEILKNSPDSILYINMNECVYLDEKRYDDFLEITRELGVKTDSVALDIGDTGIVPVHIIQSFIEHQRKNGFYISIDDIGKTYFNLDRIVVFNPDMIKINHQYLEKLNNGTYSQMVLKYIAQIAHEMGMIVIETGLENELQLQQAVDQGAQFFQGYYIHKPILVEENPEILQEQFVECLQKIMPYKKSSRILDNRQLLMKIIEFLNTLKNAESSYQPEQKNEFMQSIFETYEFVENGWITNSRGIQITGAHVNNESFSKRNCKLFHIFDTGHDYSMEESFKNLMKNFLDIWVTIPYISLLTNDICVTASAYLEADNADSDIVFLAINYDQFKKIMF